MRRAGKAITLRKGSETVNVEEDSEAFAFWTEKGFTEATEASQAKTEAKREEKIAKAIASLKQGNAAHWNQDGTPKVAAVREAGGEDLSDVSGEEVHAVWSTFK